MRTTSAIRMKHRFAVAMMALLVGKLAATEKPKILSIVADDLGFSDLGCDRPRPDPGHPPG
jgi:hypothetical protein